MKGNLMKRAFLTIMLLCLFVLGIHDAQAQEYVPGYYDQYWDGTQLYAQQYEPVTSCIRCITSYICRNSTLTYCIHTRLINCIHTRIHIRLIKYIHPAAFQEDINPGGAGTDS